MNSECTQVDDRLTAESEFDAEPSSACGQDPWDMRHTAICGAAYLLAQRRGFAPGRELDDWLAAEREFDANECGSIRTLTPWDLRQGAICDAAYMIAQRRGFVPGHELEDWLSAEQEIGASSGPAGQRARCRVIRASPDGSAR